MSNNGGTIATNGALDVKSGAVSNRGGTLAAQTSAGLAVASLDNSAGGYVGAQNVSIDDAGSLNNTGGTVQANGVLAVAAQDIANDSGTIANGGTGATTVAARGVLTNTNNGVIGGNGDVSVSGASVDNSGGTFVAAGSINTQSNSTFINRAGLIQAGADVSVSAAGAIDNTGGQIEADGPNSALSMSGASLDNTLVNTATIIGNQVTLTGAQSIVNDGAAAVMAAASELNLYSRGDTLVANGTLTEGSPEHAALHAIVACAGAAASSQSCGAGAMGAASSSLLTNLFADNPNETAQEREAKSNIIASLVAGIATADGIDATAATSAAQAATDNNYLTQKQQQARALAKANCGASSDPSACQKKVQQEFAKLWTANEAAVKECATADACKAVIGDLRAQQQAYAARENELQGKLANGTITGAEINELTSLRSSDTQLVALQTEALGNLARVGGLGELGSLEASRLIADLGIGAAPGIGAGVAAGIAGAASSLSPALQQAAATRCAASMASRCWQVRKVSIGAMSCRHRSARPASRSMPASTTAACSGRTLRFWRARNWSVR